MIIGIIGNATKPETPGAVRTLVDILVRRSIPFLLHDQLVESFPDLRDIGETVTMEALIARSTVAIAFGGDGTMLGTSRMLAGTGVPLLGINLGKLGFLAEFSVDSLESTIDDLIGGACRIVERSLLRATFPDDSTQEPLIGLNDIVIDKRGAGLMLQLETYINGDYLGTYNADGLIISTPTGSTAYSLAVGGPVVTPSSHVTVIAPIAPHMLTARPVVVPDTAVIDIYPIAHRGDRIAHVYADGQEHRNVPIPTRVSITRHDQVACLVKRTSRTYFDVLRAKLLWGREPVLNVRPEVNEGKL
jgi:NAD+ kinase